MSLSLLFRITGDITLSIPRPWQSMISPVYPQEDAAILGIAKMTLEFVGFTGAENGSTTPVSVFYLSRDKAVN